jgi:nucleoside-diphosphate-sugar epimerase
MSHNPELSVSSEGRRALVTGATGFIGGLLARRLVEEGWDVHVIVRPGSRNVDLDGLPSVVHVDDGLSPLHSIVAAAAPNVCFHLAGYFVGTHSDADIAPLVTDNLLFGTRLADALAALGGCRMVNAGSYWQNAGGNSFHPVALYAATKQAYQDILQYYVESGGLQVVTLKFFETYGPGDRRPKLVNLLLNAAATQKTLGISPGDQLIDLVHVDDAVGACLAAIHSFTTPSSPFPASYAITSGAPLHLRDLVDRIERIIGRNVPVEWGSRSYRWREMMEPWDVAPVLPGWRPEVPLDKGVRGVWQSLHRPEASDRVGL